MYPNKKTLLIEKYEVLATRAEAKTFVPDDMTTVWEIDGQRLVDDTRLIRVGGGQEAVLWVFCREAERVFFWTTMHGFFVE